MADEQEALKILEAEKAQEEQGVIEISQELEDMGPGEDAPKEYL